MKATRFEPWNLVNLMHREFDPLRARRLHPGNATGDRAAVADWVPAVDIMEEKERFVLRADLPGVDPQRIEVKMDDGVLTLSGERREESADFVDGLRRIERLGGKFQRRFRLPETADAENISARGKNGILEVSIPKRPEVMARRIAVQAA